MKIKWLIYIGCLLGSIFTPIIVSFVLVCIACGIGLVELIRLVIKIEGLEKVQCYNAPNCPHRNLVKPEEKDTGII